MDVLIGLLIFLTIDAVGTALLFRYARQNQALAQRMDAAFGILIGRKPQAASVVGEEEKNCPFCE